MAENGSDRFEHLRTQIKDLPKVPGVYLLKDGNGVVLYIGKAVVLRNRVSSYFQTSSDLMKTRGPRIADMVGKVIDIDHLVCQSDVDAILTEARLIKDIQPPYNTRQTDGKTFPYLEITTKDDFPGVFITRTPSKGSKLYGPFTSSGEVRKLVQVLQRIFQFRTCSLEIKASDDKRKYFRPCILHSIKQCTAPCADIISKETYRKDIDRLKRFLESKRTTVIKQLRAEMLQYSEDKNYEEAARLRDEIKAIEHFSDRGSVDEHVQPELFQVDPQVGVEKLTVMLDLDNPVRVIEGIDIAHIQGQETVGALVCFIDGKPFKQGYRRFRIKEVKGIDDYASIKEVVRRRYRKAGNNEALFPDVILIDGGIGQLRAALEAFSNMDVQPPKVISIAKKEELLHIDPQGKTLKLARNHPSLQLLQYIRDESHRFSQHYHHLLRKKKTFK